MVVFRQQAGHLLAVLALLRRVVCRWLRGGSEIGCVVTPLIADRVRLEVVIGTLHLPGATQRLAVSAAPSTGAGASDDESSPGRDAAPAAADGASTAASTCSPAYITPGLRPRGTPLSAAYIVSYGLIVDMNFMKLNFIMSFPGWHLTPNTPALAEAPPRYVSEQYMAFSCCKLHFLHLLMKTGRPVGVT